MTASAANSPSSRRSVLPVVILAMSVLVCVVWMLHGLRYLEDDGWIHLEFARSLATGRGFSFNGHVVYGDTSPLWVWLLCAVHAVYPHWESSSKLLDLGGCMFAVAAVYSFGRSLTRTLPAEQSRLFGALATLVLVTGPYFGYWSFSGMEALTACGLAATACTLIARERFGPTAFLAAALCGGLAPLLRPEMAFLSVLLGIALLIRLLRSPQSPGAKALLFLAGLLLITLPFTLWARYAVHTFGTVLPTTNAAKRAAPGNSVIWRLISIYGFGFPEALLGIAGLAFWSLAAAVRGGFARVRPLYVRLGIGALLLFVWMAIAVCFYIADHTYVQTRYIMVNAPLLAIVVLAAAALLAPKLYRVAVVLTVLFGVAMSSLATWPLVHNKVVQNAVVAQLAAYLRTMPPNAPVADYSIGQIAFQSEHPIVDTGGITRPGMIPYMWDRTPDRSAAWIRSQGAAYIVSSQPGPSATLVWRHSVAPVGWNLHHSYYSTDDQIELWTMPPGPSDPTKLPAR